MVSTIIIACIIINFGVITLLIAQVVNKNATIKLLESLNEKRWDIINDIIENFKEVKEQIAESAEKCTEIVNQIDGKSN